MVDDFMMKLQPVANYLATGFFAFDDGTAASKFKFDYSDVVIVTATT